MHLDDLLIEKTHRPPDLLGYGTDAEPGLAVHPRKFGRAMVIGVPVALVMWAGIGFAIFRAVAQG